MHIALESVTKRYGKVKALDSVSLEIPPGEIVCVVGINGAGKTTLLRCLGGIAVPDSGEVRYDHRKFSRGEIDLRRKIAYLPDFPIGFPHNTVLRHIGMTLRLYDADDAGAEARVMHLLRGFDLLPLIETPIGQLSRGQVYKAALSALLAADPELLLLDEPFASGMDPNGITFLKREAVSFVRRGRTILYSTQILDVAEKLSDRVCVIDRGQVRYFSPVGDLPKGSDTADSGLEGVFQRLREDAR